MGIFYDRHSKSADHESWHVPANEETITVNTAAFRKFYPGVTIRGEIERQCGENCDDCGRCGQSVEFFPGMLIGKISNERPTHRIGEFKWDWSGHGVTEHWFDEAVCLAKTDCDCSGSGLTADSTRIVAYKRHMKVQSFRYGLSDARIIPKPGNIWAEFKNMPSEYRANWTGFALGYMPKDESGCIDLVPVVSDDLDGMVETMLAGQIGEPITCKHNQNVQVHILTADPSRISFLLCKACRMQGVQVAEFTGRNRQDTCPYFRRACKSVVEKSDAFPEWFEWSGDNLLSSTLRMKDGEHLAYEVAYIRKDGFIRRAVLLFNERTHEVWMYRYAGFIPRTTMEFFGKYAEGRQISGYLGTGPAEYCSDPEDKFLSEVKVAAAVVEGRKEPLWEGEGAMLLRFDLGQYSRRELSRLAIRGRAEICGIRIAFHDRDGRECETEETKNLTSFYTDEAARCYLIYSSDEYTVLCHAHDGGEIYRASRRYEWYLLRIAKSKVDVSAGSILVDSEPASEDTQFTEGADVTLMVS